MNPTNDDNTALPRRGLLGALLAGSAASVTLATSVAQDPGTNASAAEERAREALRRRRAPNVWLQDDRGRSVRFYDDVMKGRTVLLNVMYGACSNVCPPATRHLIEARRLLGDVARGVHFASMSLTPLADTPQALRDYKKLHGIDADWTFLTGTPGNVERVQRALGFIGNDADDDLLGHSAMALLCDERQLRWGHVNTLLSPRSIARMIRFEMV